jgi:hypothetical protein
VIDVPLHATPRWRDVVLEQIRIVGLSLGTAAMILAAVLAVGTVMIVGEIVTGGAGFDSNETFPTALIAFLYPFAVWRNEKRFGPALLWTFPVERRRLALAKVFAGFVWLMAAVAFFLLWLFALGLFAGARPELTVARVPLIATIATYLFGSALVLGLNHPLRWLLGAAGVLALIGRLGDVISHPDNREWNYVPGARAAFALIEEAFSAWATLPAPAQWILTILLTIGLGLIAVWAAASRHRERHRHRKRQR